MDKLSLVAIMILSLNLLFWIQAYAQNVTLPDATPESSAEAVAQSYTALITSIGTLVATIGSIIGVFAVFIKNKQTKAEVQQVGLGMVTFGQKTNEVNDRVKNLIKAGYYMSPEEAKKFLLDNKMTVENVTETVNKGTEQLEVIKDNLSGNTTAKISAWQKTLPKESFDTRPGATT